MFGDDNTYNPIIDLAGYREARETDNVIPFKASSVRSMKSRQMSGQGGECRVISLAMRRMSVLGTNYV